MFDPGFVMYFESFLVLQSSHKGKESQLLHLNFNILAYMYLNTMFTRFQFFGHLAFVKKQITGIML